MICSRGTLDGGGAASCACCVLAARSALPVFCYFSSEPLCIYAEKSVQSCVQAGIHQLCFGTGSLSRRKVDCTASSCLSRCDFLHLAFDEISPRYLKGGSVLQSTGSSRSTALSSMPRAKQSGSWRLFVVFMARCAGLRATLNAVKTS